MASIFAGLGILSAILIQYASWLIHHRFVVAQEHFEIIYFYIIIIIEIEFYWIEREFNYIIEKEFNRISKI